MLIRAGIKQYAICKESIMKSKQLLCGLMLLGSAVFSSAALAEHGGGRLGAHGGFELSIGVPFYASPYYVYPYAYHKLTTRGQL